MNELWNIYCQLVYYFILKCLLIIRQEVNSVQTLIAKMLSAARTDLAKYCAT